MTAAAMAKPRTSIPVKSIVLPIEHGSWGFLLEPIALGLILAPSLPAVFITITVVGAFLTRQPLKFLIADLRQGRRLPRTEIAQRYGLIFAGVAALGLVGTLLTAPLASLVPLAAAVPLAGYVMLQDAARQSRELVPEILAAVALSASTAAIVAAGGGSWPIALSMWGIMLARLVPSIVYVRSRLRLEKGKEFSRLPSIVLHVAAAAAAAGFFAYGTGPFLTVAMMALLLGRSIVGLSPIRVPAKAKQIGIEEVAYGVLTVLSVVFGFYFKI
ncbi:MAG: YwiC-like family protein [Pyrinomonadaceae bacterium]